MPILTAARDAEPPVKPTLVVPRIDRVPTLEDFLDMKPNPATEGKPAKVTGFTQSLVRDGEPVSQRTEAYLGYDLQNFYAIFISFDSDPDQLRARLIPR